MRERLAKTLAATLTGLVVLLAAFFADRRNAVDVSASETVPPAAPAPTAGTPTDPALVASGRAVFEAHACTRCHSLEGRGNPRSPLDGVGARLTPAELRSWITGTGPASDRLSRSVLRTKGGFAELPDEEMEALVAFLRSSR